VTLVYTHETDISYTHGMNKVLVFVYGSGKAPIHYTQTKVGKSMQNNFKNTEIENIFSLIRKCANKVVCVYIYLIN